MFADSVSPFATDLLPVLSSNPYVQAQAVASGEILQPLRPTSPSIRARPCRRSPHINSIWFLSGSASAAARPVRVTAWNSQHPVTRWVRTHDVSVRNPATLARVCPAIPCLAYTEGTPPAPLILAREQNGHRLLIVGFDPHDSNFPLESAFPLLMAGAMEWMTHSVDEVADSLFHGRTGSCPDRSRESLLHRARMCRSRAKATDVHLLALQTGIYRVDGARRRNSHRREYSAAAGAADDSRLPRNRQRSKVNRSNQNSRICGAGWCSWRSSRCGWNGGSITLPASGSERRRSGKCPAMNSLSMIDGEPREREESEPRNRIWWCR